MTSPVLEIQDLNVEFPLLAGAVKAVRGCALCVGEGEIVGLVGESGSGKSVTAMACLGLVAPPGVARGSIRVAGEEVLGRGERELWRARGGKAAMIFQNPATALNPFFTVGDQVSDVIGQHLGVSRKEAREATAAAFHDVRLPDARKALAKYPHQMSGGQLQRVMIAMALGCRPKLLIADEPTTALDVTVQAQILALLLELVKDAGLSVLFITHDLGVVASICDRVAVMYAGTIVEQAGIVDLFEHPRHPYTANLLHSVPQLGRKSGRLEAIPGQVPNLEHLPGGCPFHPRCERADPGCIETEPALETGGNGRAVACHHPLTAPARPTTQHEEAVS